MKRRSFVQASVALGTLGSLVGCATIPDKAKVVVIGGGYGGATAAKYVRMMSNYRIDVVLVEPNDNFVSCPISNRARRLQVDRRYHHALRQFAQQARRDPRQRPRHPH